MAKEQIRQVLVGPIGHTVDLRAQIAERLQAAGKTWRDLAEALDTSETMLSTTLAHERPALPIVLGVLGYLNLRPADFFEPIGMEGL